MNFTRLLRITGKILSGRFVIGMFGALLIPVLAACVTAEVATSATSVSTHSALLGPIPIQYANAGEKTTIDSKRFFSPEPGLTLTSPSGGDYTVEWDPQSGILSYRINENRVGLVDIPLEVHTAAGNVVSRGVLSVVAGKKQRHTFTYAPGKPISRAVVAGSFNDWNQDRNVLTDPDGDGVFQCEAWLDAGNYLYKFVVDGSWIPDPGNASKSEDGFGGFNSVLEIGGSAAKSEPPSLYVSRREGNDVVVSVIRKTHPIRDVSVVLELADGSNMTVPYVYIERMGELRVAAQNHPKGSWIRIAACDDKGQVSNSVRFPCHDDGEFTWNDAVLYFAFTDRFMNGDPSIDRPDPNPEVLPPANYHGGDLKGVRNMIENGYFESLGVNTIWISPLNRNPEFAEREYLAPYRLYTGYHGYWPVSPTEIDPRFGDKAELKRLVAAAHARGMKVMVDLVLNHVHKDHPFFKEHPDWFTKLELPDGTRNLRMWNEHPYTTWFDVFLPDIDFDNPAAEKAILENAAWWAEEYDFDAFRLDAVKHIQPSFWYKLRSHLSRTAERKLGRRMYLVGETFLDRHGIMSFVGPAMLDGQFDFPLYDSIMSVLARQASGFGDLENSLAASERIYGKVSLMSPLAGNHDKSRFMAYADHDLPNPNQPDEEEVGWENPPKVDCDCNYALLKLAMTFIMSIDGVPMIYYGDEYGMTGAADPDNRRDFRHGDSLTIAEQEMLNHTAKVVKIRNAHPALRYGSRRAILVEEDKYAFVRAYFGDRVLVAFNRSDQALKLELDVAPELPNGSYVNLMTGDEVTVANGKLVLELGVRSAAIVSPKPR